MDFCILNSVVVEVVDIERTEREVLGETQRAFDMTLRSTVAGYKDNWRINTRPLTTAEANTLETAIGLGAISVSGPMFAPLGGTEFAAYVHVTSRKAVKDGTGIQWSLGIDIKQV